MLLLYPYRIGTLYVRAFRSADRLIAFERFPLVFESEQGAKGTTAKRMRQHLSALAQHEFGIPN